MEKIGSKLLQVGDLLRIPILDSPARRIFVTGGTGVVGYRAVKKLLLAGHPLMRFGCHYSSQKDGPKSNVELVHELNEMGGEYADFRWSDESTYGTALRGVHTVFCTAPYVNDWESVFPAFLEECKKAGVQHIVRLSFYHARKSGDAFQSVSLVRAHGDLDEMLVQSGISYTILSATHFMSNPFYFQNGELRRNQNPAVLYGASGGKAVNYVSPNDVAEVAMHVLVHPRPHAQKEYTLTGPEPIREEDVAKFLSVYLKKPIVFADQPLHTFEERERNCTDHVWMTFDLVALESIKASGEEEMDSFVTADIEQVCGHKAQSYEEYLKATDFMTPMEAA